MRALGFTVGLSAAAAVWYWQQAPELEPEPVAAETNLVTEMPDRDFGSDLGDFGTDTYRVPSSAEWVVKPSVAAEAPTRPEWLVITRPFSSETSAQAFSEAVAQDTGLAMAVQSSDFRQYQVAVRLDASLSREQALTTLGEHYTWMQFE